MLSELLDALVREYVINGRKSTDKLKSHLKPLRRAFALDAATRITEPRIERYKAQRLAEGKAPATVNRELAALKRAFKIGVRLKTISAAPFIEMLAENNARQGFVEPADFDALLEHRPAELKDFALFAYGSGWRRGELERLEWSAVDKDNTRVTLRREHSKSGEPRVLPLVGELAEIINRQRDEREYKTKGGETVVSRYVFHRHGKLMGDFRKAWAAACIAAGFSRARSRQWPARAGRRRNAQCWRRR